MATYLADRVIVFEGEASVSTVAHTPQSLLAGMNRFLELLGITFRRDPNNFRPRINKDKSVKVIEYFFSYAFFYGKQSHFEVEDFQLYLEPPNSKIHYFLLRIFYYYI